MATPRRTPPKPTAQDRTRLLDLPLRRLHHALTHSATLKEPRRWYLVRTLMVFNAVTLTNELTAAELATVLHTLERRPPDYHDWQDDDTLTTRTCALCARYERYLPAHGGWTPVPPPPTPAPARRPMPKTSRFLSGLEHARRRGSLSSAEQAKTKRDDASVAPLDAVG